MVWEFNWHKLSTTFHLKWSRDVRSIFVKTYVWEILRVWTFTESLNEYANGG
jgi:hypothetical protein